jgi:hypothetical protein
VRPSVIHILILAVVLGMGLPTDGAEAPLFSAKLHPWGRFSPGTWKTVRVVTETLDEQGRVVSTATTDTKSILLDMDNDGVTLEIQACMEVAGKRFESEPQTVKQGFHGEPLGSTVKLDEPADAEVVIEGRKIPCKLQRLESVAPKGKTDTLIYYSLATAPCVLKRDTVVTTDPEGKNELSKTVVEVTALNMPVEVQGEIKNGMLVRTVHKNATGTVTTVAEVVPEVPGGVIRNSSKEIDQSGRLVRRSTLKLIDYNGDPDKDRSGLFGRKRTSRHHKPGSLYAP